MHPCNERVVKCALDSPDCHYHKKCDWCGEYHFREIPIPTIPYKNKYGLEGSMAMPSTWPPIKPLNIACAGRAKR